jgi:sec-independent protein translocase protein TatC
MANLSQEKHMSFIEHLEEFRWLLFRSLLSIIIFLPITFWGAQPIIDYVITNCATKGFSLQYFKLMEPFITELKVALILALSLAFPYIAWQFWKFVTPGLYNKERRRIKYWAVLSWVLFITGTAFSYFIILPIIVHFSLSFQRELVRPLLGLGDFISMTVLLLLSFGLIFQLPIIIMILVGFGVVKKSTLKKQRSLIIVSIALASALLTPPDVMSQLAMALPTYILFEFSLLLSREPKIDAVNIANNIEKQKK